MKRRLWILSAILALLIAGLTAQAQDITPIEPPADDAELAITFPPPVWTLRGAVSIRGTVDVVNLSSYVVEYRQIDLLAEDETEVEDDDDDATSEPATEMWFEATLPGNAVVVNDVLGTWNTTSVDDGLYEIRLKVTSIGGEQETFRVGPLRVANDLSAQGVEIVAVPTLFPTPTNLPGGAPEIRPSPTGLNTTDPFVTALLDANIRAGDAPSSPVVGFLLEDEEAIVLGVSTSGSGWLYIETVDGIEGFIAPSVVAFTGDFDSLAPVVPPPPLDTPTPEPTATPQTTANLQVTGLRLEPAVPQCGASFDIFVNVTNSGTGATSASGTLSVADRADRPQTITASTTGGFPVIQPGGNFVVVATLTVDTFTNESHTVIVTVDNGGAIPETNESDNSLSTSYVLGQASCG
ncbi:MAG: CARDB domain-containing protein [Chloroflexota bacterium]